MVEEVTLRDQGRPVGGEQHSEIYSVFLLESQKVKGFWGRVLVSGLALELKRGYCCSQGLM